MNPIPSQQDIVKAALEVFAQYGYDGATITEIAKRAGINPATIYRFFAGKQELFQALGRPDLKFPDAAEQATRQRICRSALRQFGRKGYSAATMDDIAMDAGLSKAGVYFYFPSKEELFMAALEKSPGFSALESAAANPVDGNTGDIEKILVRLAETYLMLFSNEEFSALLRIVLSEGLHDDRIACIFQQKAIEAGSMTIAGYLERFVTLNKDELAVRVRSFFGMLFSWGLVNILMRPGQQVDAAAIKGAAQMMASQFLYGMSQILKER